MDYFDTKTRTRLWWVVAALAIIFVLMLFAPVTQSAQIRFEWINAIERVDGSAFLATDIERTNIYCGGALVAFATNDATSLVVDLGAGTYECHGTHVDRISGLESAPSNTVTKVVDFARSNPPTLFP